MVLSLQNKAHYRFMARAIHLAQKGKYTTHPNPRVGCVIVKNNRIIGEGFHRRAGGPHAEIDALNQCQKSPGGATVYVTLEPCSHTGKTPPCANALIDSGVSQVIVAMQDPNPQVAGQGMRRLIEAGINVESGILEEQARELNPGFIKRMEQGVPWVRIKLAMSLDGRTAMASGESQWITGPDARADVQRLRACADAILTGSGTVLADNPSLNVRLSAAELGIEGNVRQPRKVIVDSRLRSPENSRLFQLAGKTLICTCNQDTHRQADLMGKTGVNIAQFDPDENGRLPLKQVLRLLALKETNEVHVEAGAMLCGALVQQGLVDEIVIYSAPILMGSAAKGLLDLPGVDHLVDKIQLDIQDIRAIGRDWRISATIR